MSPCPYHNAFEEEINLRKFDMTKHPTAGLCFFEKDNRIHLATMSPHTPGDRIHYWRTNIRGAWLIAINGTIITSIADAQNAFEQLRLSQAKEATLTFAHPEVSRDISNKGLPILSTEDFSQATLDQLNNRKDILYRKSYDVVDSGHVLNYTTKVSRLTRGKLLQQQDWDDWHQSEYLQLDQYDSQGMFGEPTAVTTDDAIFHLVWTYNIKAADGRKKARCVCDGSTRSGHVKILDKTYANCVDQTSARLFYAVTAAENLFIFGADVSNAFAEAPPPKQGFYIRPDKAFNDWWINHKKRPPIPTGHVIPINSAMQGHPESPRLWEKHADAILRDIGLTPTVHEPCLYSGLINNTRVILMPQVDDFAIASPDEHTAALLLDMIDDKLSIPLKRQGLIDMFNIDVTQTKYRPQHDATTAVAYADSDWATCIKTRRSFTGACIFLAGGVVAYKAKFQPTVALSSTEAEFMAACDAGRMCLFIRSILWDLDIPQEAATTVYEDNNGCTSMGNAQKPTARTRHIDIRYFALCEWIERDLIHLERIDTSINNADHLTKPLTRTLFHRHADFLLGHVPPAYSPVHNSITQMYDDRYNIDKYIPATFTTPTLAKVQRIWRPNHEDTLGNPWIPILWHGEDYNSHLTV